jgi:hypothetical protein
MPPGLLDAVREEAERTAAERSGGTVTPLGGGAHAGRWQKAIAALGAAAAVLLIGALILPNLGTGSDQTARVEAGADSGAANGPQAPTAFGPTRATAVDVADIDYDAQTAGDLAKDFASGGAAPPFDAVTPGAEATTAEGPAADAVRTATTCLRAAFGDLPGQPVRLIRARYARSPAYLGVFLIGPGAGQPATAVRVLIADVDSCATLGSSEARIGG